MQVGRRVPLKIWLPLLLALAAGVVRLKQWQLEERSRRAHEWLTEGSREHEARTRWIDSVLQAEAPAPQRELMERTERGCRQLDSGLTVHDTLDIRNYRDDAKRVTDWVGELRVRDSLRITSHPLWFVYDGALTDSLRRMAVPNHAHVVRFSARISLAPEDGACTVGFVIRNIQLSRIAANFPATGATHEGH